MTTVPNPSSSSKAKIFIPSTNTKSTPASGKKENRPEFVVRTNYPDSNAPLGVSVPKFNRNHVVVRNTAKTMKSILFHIIILSFIFSLHINVY
jgi:hypothetical protein